MERQTEEGRGILDWGKRRVKRSSGLRSGGAWNSSRGREWGPQKMKKERNKLEGEEGRQFFLRQKGSASSFFKEKRERNERSSKREKS